MKVSCIRFLCTLSGVLCAFLVLFGCRRSKDHAEQSSVGGGSLSAPLLTAPFRDDFAREELGEAWASTAEKEVWRLEEGKLCVHRAHNHGIWLRRTLPPNVRITFEAKSESPEGDIKAELFGDGVSAATQVSYTDATSYLAVFGGWKNRYHVLARLDEHGADRRERVVQAESLDLGDHPVIPGKWYRMQLERTEGHTVRFLVEDTLLLSWTDPTPLVGPGHDRFGFNGWETPVCFRHLEVTPLP